MAIPDITPEITAFQDAAYGEEVRSALVQLAIKLRGVITGELNDMSATWNAFKSLVESDIADMGDAWTTYSGQLNEEWDDYKTDLNEAWSGYQSTINSMVDLLDDPWNEPKLLTENDDFDDIVRGVYWYLATSCPANAPSIIENGVVFCFGNTNRYTYQLALVRDTSERLFLRTRNESSTFREWREIKYIDKALYDSINDSLTEPKHDAFSIYEHIPHNQYARFTMPGLSVMDDSGNIEYNLNDFPKANHMYHTTHPGLIISDSNGNIVVEFSHGKTNSLAGKTVSFIGDSITTFSGWMPEGYATSYPHSYLDDVKDTWWHKLLEQTGMRLIQNCSWSGSKVSGDSASTTNARAASSNKRVQDVSGPNNEAPDFIIILISVNDFRASVQLGEWSYNKAIPSDGTTTTLTDAYMLMINKIHTLYPLSHVFCCTILPQTYGTDDIYPIFNGNNVSQAEWNQRIRDIATSMNCSIIDFYANCKFTGQNIATYTGDRLHPNVLGANIMTNIARSTIEQYNDSL